MCVCGPTGHILGQLDSGVVEMLSMLSQTTVSALGFAGAHGVGCCWEQEIKDGKSDMDLLKIARVRVLSIVCTFLKLGGRG